MLLVSGLHEEEPRSWSGGTCLQRAPSASNASPHLGDETQDDETARRVHHSPGSLFQSSLTCKAPCVSDLLRAMKCSWPIGIPTTAPALAQSGATSSFRSCIDAASFSTSDRRTSLIRRSSIYSFVFNTPSPISRLILYRDTRRTARARCTAGEPPDDTWPGRHCYPFWRRVSREGRSNGYEKRLAHRTFRHWARWAIARKVAGDDAVSHAFWYSGDWLD
jgi:hypothetical protein